MTHRRDDTPDATGTNAFEEAGPFAEADGFDELVRAHRPDVLALARSILGNVHDAEDAAQEAFLAALKGRDGLRDASKFAPWVLAITRRESWRRLKQLRRRRTRPVVSVPEPEAPAPDAPARFSAAAVTEALGGLKARPRTALLLFHREGRSHAEIARLMGARQSQVRNWIHRARRRMRTALLSKERRENER